MVSYSLEILNKLHSGVLKCTIIFEKDEYSAKVNCEIFEFL